MEKEATTEVQKGSFDEAMDCGGCCDSSKQKYSSEHGTVTTVEHSDSATYSDEISSEVDYVIIETKHLTESTFQPSNDETEQLTIGLNAIPAQNATNTSLTSRSSSDVRKIDLKQNEEQLKNDLTKTSNNVQNNDNDNCEKTGVLKMLLQAIKKSEILAGSNSGLASSFNENDDNDDDDNVEVLLGALNNILDLAINRSTPKRKRNLLKQRDLEILDLREENAKLQKKLQTARYHISEWAKDLSTYEGESRRMRDLLCFPSEKLYYECSSAVREIKQEKYELLSGVAATSKRIFVALLRDSDLRVYDVETLQPLPRIPVPGLRKTEDIVINQHDIALYISDEGKIHKVDLLDHSVERWEVLEGNPGGLSITPNNSLLVVVQKLEDSSQGLVVEYSSDGKILRRIDFKDKFPWRSAQLSNGNLVVCHGSRVDLPLVQKDPASGITLVDSNAASFTGPTLENIFSCPRSVVIDQSRGTLLIADFINNCISVVNEENTEALHLDIQCDLIQPYRLSLHQPSGLLCIGENGGRIVIVKLCLPLLSTTVS